MEERGREECRGEQKAGEEERAEGVTEGSGRGETRGAGLGGEEPARERVREGPAPAPPRLPSCLPRPPSPPH